MNSSTIEKTWNKTKRPARGVVKSRIAVADQKTLPASYSYLEQRQFTVVAVIVLLSAMMMVAAVWMVRLLG